MRKFFIQITGFTFLVITSFLGLLSLADGYTDGFYLRFTTPKQNNLIIGTSKAAQGLQPDVFNNQLNKIFYNYSFTIGQSPFGPTYLESIKKKINDDERKGVFIVAIDPWSISSITSNPNDLYNFREVKNSLGNTSIVDAKPNFQYLLKNLSGSYFDKIVLNKIRKPLIYLHSDGWLEVSVSMDSRSVNERLYKKVKTYRSKNLPRYNFSKLRLNYLLKTIVFLNEHGKVYLVRLPIHPEIMEIENELMPDFEQKIKGIIPLTSGYLDMTNLNDQLSYTDGNHLYKKSGKLVSEKLAQWIKKIY